MSFDTFLGAAVAPMDALGCELDLPLSKLLRASDVETDVTQNRFRRRTCGDAMPILIRPHIGDLSVRGSASRKSQHITRKILKSFAIRYANSDLHNIADCRHSMPSFPRNGRRPRKSSVNPSASHHPSYPSLASLVASSAKLPWVESAVKNFKTLPRRQSPRTLGVLDEAQRAEPRDSATSLARVRMPADEFENSLIEKLGPLPVNRMPALRRYGHLVVGNVPRDHPCDRRRS